MIYRVDFFTSLYWFINLHVNIYLAIDSLSVKESKDCNPFFRHMNLAKLFYLMIKIFANRVVWQVKSTILKKTAYELERTKIKNIVRVTRSKASFSVEVATVTSRCFAHCARQAHEIFQEVEVLKRY